MKILNKVVASAIGLALLGSAIPAFAETSTTTNAALVNQISSLLQQINTLQAQIVELNKKRGDLTSSLAQTLNLARSLSLGMSGGDVTLLQQILAADPEVYPEGLTTGYFGSLTERAVRKFQRKHGIDQAGIVGPKTLARLNKWLNNDDDDGDGDDQDDDDDNWRRNFKKNFATITATTTPGMHITICHKPGGNKDEGQTITIGAPAWFAHMKHGDTIGACGTGNTATTTPPTATTTPDIIAPIISNLSATSTASTTATISWSTNEASRSTVWYSATTPVATSTATSMSEGTLKTNHLFNLSGLTASTTYYYKVESKDEALNAVTSSESYFMTP